MTTRFREIQFFCLEQHSKKNKILTISTALTQEEENEEKIMMREKNYFEILFVVGKNKYTPLKLLLF